MIDWSGLLTFNFWFARQPGALAGPITKFLLVVFGLCLVTAVILYFVSRSKRGNKAVFRIFRKIKSLLTTMGIFGFIILFLFWQQVPYLSSRFWLIVWVLVACIWAGFVGQFGFFEAPKIVAAEKEKEAKLKYLPPRRKK
ncbi:MAG: hypothetical protein WC310_00445 [Patescibacteria group bacterium]|jgi:amino acid transporter